MSPTNIGFIAIFCWVLSAVLVALVRDLPPFEVMTFTWAIALLLLLGNAVIKKEKIIYRRPVFDYVLVLTGVTLNVLLFYIAFCYAPPFEANVLNYLWPILVIALIDITEKRRPNIKKILGMALGFAGCVMLMVSRGGSFGFESFTIGHVSALACAVTWAGYSVLAKGRTYPSSFMIPIFSISLLLSLVISFAVEEWVLPRTDQLIIILVLGVIRLGYSFWDYGMRKGDRVLLTSLSYFIPLFSTLLLVLFGFGAASKLIFLAGWFIIVGCLVVNADKILSLSRRKVSHDPLETYN